MMIVDGPIRPEDHLKEFQDPACGAVVTFTGVIRSSNGGRRVSHMFYDCYREMADRELAKLAEEIKSSNALEAVRVWHRIGRVDVGEVSLLVIVWAAHRRAAFEANEQIVDGIKKNVPIWKKECYTDGTAEWL
jgi:molybdopterin synthase catalytic subunit